ncbi:hypothetical protein PX674_14020, partial [Lacticaseibacillus paracasei]|uniref:hypothetical protein n=1 Tax=Lacticaseibacillus paracasei TaxID=1597 RepID=UPI0023A93DA2
SVIARKKQKAALIVLEKPYHFFVECYFRNNFWPCHGKQVRTSFSVGKIKANKFLLKGNLFAFACS